MNCSSPIIGSPLHVASADNIPNRMEILQVRCVKRKHNALSVWFYFFSFLFVLQMLLSEGADPNLKVYNDINDRNSQLRPVLVEYLASNENPSLAVVNLLLRHGAKVNIVNCSLLQLPLIPKQNCI